jgi:hypothetical protein
MHVGVMAGKKPCLLQPMEVLEWACGSSVDTLCKLQRGPPAHKCWFPALFCRKGGVNTLHRLTRKGYPARLYTGFAVFSLEC